MAERARGKTISLSVPMNYLINMPEVHDAAVPTVMVPEKQWQLPIIEDKTIDYNNSLVSDVQQADFVASSIAVPSPQIADSYRFVSTNYHRPVLFDRKVKLKDTNYVLDDVLDNFTSGKTYSQMSRNYGLNQVNCTNSVLATTIERYSNVKPIKYTHNVHERAKLLRQGFSKFVDYSKLRAPTTEEFSLCVAQAVSRIAVKQSQPKTGIYGEPDTVHNIKCFNKNQLKSKVGDYAWLTAKQDSGDIFIKGGQMVSAQTKETNQKTAAWVAWTERCVFASMVEGVFPGYGHSPAHLRKLILPYISVPDAYECVSIDITQQDTTKGKDTDQFMRELYTKCGVPSDIIDSLELPNKRWIMKADKVSTRVEGQFQSGRSDTLFANSCHSLALAGQSFSIIDLQLAVFQGDDVYLRARNLTKTSDFFPLLKTDFNKVGEFIGFLIADDLYLDIARLASKTLSRTFTHKERREQLQIAVRDLLSVQRDNFHVYKSIVINSIQRQITFGQVLILWDYLRRFAIDATFCLPRPTLGSTESSEVVSIVQLVFHYDGINR